MKNLKSVLLSLLVTMSGLAYGQLTWNLDECGLDGDGNTPVLNVGDTLRMRYNGEDLQILGSCDTASPSGPGDVFLIVENCVNNVYYVFRPNYNGSLPCDNGWIYWGAVIRKAFQISNATSITELQKPNIEIYPNPSTGQVSMISDVRTLLEIFNTSGQKVFEVFLNNGINQLNLDLPKGMYLVRSNQFAGRLTILN